MLVEHPQVQQPSGESESVKQAETQDDPPDPTPEQRQQEVAGREHDRGGDRGLHQPLRQADSRQGHQAEGDAVGDHQGGHDRDDVAERRREALDSPPLPGLAPQRHRQQQSDQEDQVVEAQEDVLGAQPYDRQEPAQAAGGGQVELLPAGARTEDQGDAVLVGEGAGGPVVLDEEEAAVARLFVEQDRVVDRQAVGDPVQSAEVEGQQDVSAARPEEAVLREVDRQRPGPVRDGDALEVVLLEKADPLVEVLRGDLELGSRQAERRVEVRQGDLEPAAHRLLVDLQVQVAVAEVVGAARGRREHGERADKAPAQRPAEAHSPRTSGRPAGFAQPSPRSPAIRFL